MQEEQTRRKSPRASTSFIAYCCQEDLNEVGIKVCNLSTGGMGIKTNYPLNLKERLAVAFQLPRSLKLPAASCRESSKCKEGIPCYCSSLANPAAPPNRDLRFATTSYGECARCSIFNTVLCVSAEVIWLQPNGGASGHDETLLTGGIRFRYLQESTQALLNEYIQNLSD